MFRSVIFNRVYVKSRTCLLLSLRCSIAEALNPALMNFVTLLIQLKFFSRCILLNASYLCYTR